MSISPSEMVGNSRGRPPAAITPRLTASATWRRWALQLLSSLQELQMPMNGFESKTLNRKFDVVFFGTLEGAAPTADAYGKQWDKWLKK